MDYILLDTAFYKVCKQLDPAEEDIKLLSPADQVLFEWSLV